jgi:hypothetical protein
MECQETFGNKGDWKRHENSEHYHLEMWRCDERTEDDGCGTVCYRQQTFQNHLKKEHQLNDDAIKAKLELYRIGRNCQNHFWCGFCIKLTDLRAKGLAAWTERFDHIDDHFMGRGDLVQKSIQDWVPVDGKSRNAMKLV